MEKSPEQLLALKICRDLFLFSIQTPTVYFHNMNIFIYVCMQFCYGPFCTTYSYWADMFKKLVSFFIQKLSCWRVNVCIKNWKALETFRLGLFYVYTKPLSCCSSKIFTWLVLRCSEQKRQAVYNSNLVLSSLFCCIYIYMVLNIFSLAKLSQQTC